MAQSKSLIFLILLLCCSTYSYWLSGKDYEWIVPHISDRSPAAVRTSDNFKEIIEKPLRVYKRESVIDSIQVSYKNGKSFFSMGQFSVPTTNQQTNQANLVCLEYPVLRLKFLGEGTTVNGRKPSAVINTVCAIQDKNHDDVKQVPLPFSDLQRLPAQNQRLDYSQPNFPVQIEFEDIQGDWPTLWHLESVEFLKDSSPEAGKVIFSNNDILQKLAEPISVQ